MAGDPLKSSESFLDLHYQSLAARELNAKQMELDSATAKLDELRRELEKRRAPSKVENLEVAAQNSGSSLSPSLARRSHSATALSSLATTSSVQSNWPRTQDSSSLSAPMTPPSLSVTPSNSMPHLSPNMSRRSLPSDNADPYSPTRSPWARPSSPRPQYYDRPARLSSSSYDYNMAARSASPAPEGPLAMSRYSDWTPHQRQPAAYEVPLGFAPPRYPDDAGGLRRRPPQRSWNESDLDVVYDKKPPQDRLERSSLGGVPIMKAWRESSLDPAPAKGKGDAASTLPRGYKFSSMERGGPPGPDPAWKAGGGGPPGLDPAWKAGGGGPPGLDPAWKAGGGGPPGLDPVWKAGGGGPPGLDPVWKAGGGGPPGLDPTWRAGGGGPPGLDPVWKAGGGGTLPRSLPSQQPISRIAVPPVGGRGQPHRPLPLSMIFRLQNAFWEHQVPSHICAPPTAPPTSIPVMMDPTAPPTSIPVMMDPTAPPTFIPVMVDPPSPASPAPPPPITEELPRPLSPTRLQPTLPPQLADVQRVLEEIPRPLRRRGSQELTSLAPPLPTDRRQYRQIMGRLFGRAAPKTGFASEQPKMEEKLQVFGSKGSPRMEEPIAEEPYFKIPPIPEGPEERPDPLSPRPADDPVCVFLEASESRVGASAQMPGDADLPIPVVVSGGHTQARRSALKSEKSPRKCRRARLDPLILLLDGALSGELDVVTHALNEVNDPSLPNEEGITALHNAICGANFHIVTLLINSGANVNAADSHGWTPLHCAASCNDLQMCAALVRHGAAIFATTYSDGSLAVEKCDPYREGYKDCLTYLTEVEECMGETQSGVVYALWDYSAEFADELSVREGDSVTVLRKDGEGGAWWWACHCGREGYIPRNYFGMYPRLHPQRSPL